ncbi:hypothetical protein GCM10009719_29590 [Nocardioides kribbensis]
MVLPSKAGPPRVARPPWRRGAGQVLPVILTHLLTQPGLCSLRYAGDLDAFTAASIRRAVGDALASGCRQVVLDLTDVAFVDASALGVLARTWADVTRSGAGIVIESASATFERTSQRAGTTAVFASA